MVDGTMERATLIRRTLVTVGAMLGACVAVVGTLTLLAVLVVGRVVGGSGQGPQAAVAAPPGARGAVGSPAPSAAAGIQRK